MPIEYKVSDDYIDYQYALEFMQNRVNKIYLHSAEEMCWLLEHPSLYTIGTNGSSHDILQPFNTPIIQTTRGGKVTYHGPGQKVAYVMLNLNNRKKDLREYAYTLEQWLINTLKDFNLNAYRKKGYIGVWVTNKNNKSYKIASIGVKISKWITYHGVAININPDLHYFHNIIPCGIKEYEITSMYQMGIKVTAQEIEQSLKRHFFLLF